MHRDSARDRWHLRFLHILTTVSTTSEPLWVACRRTNRLSPQVGSLEYDPVSSIARVLTVRFHGRKYVLAVRLCARCEMGQVVFETQLHAWVSRGCTLVVHFSLRTLLARYPCWHASTRPLSRVQCAPATRTSFRSSPLAPVQGAASAAQLLSGKGRAGPSPPQSLCLTRIGITDFRRRVEHVASVCARVDERDVGPPPTPRLQHARSRLAQHLKIVGRSADAPQLAPLLLPVVRSPQHAHLFRAPALVTMSGAFARLHDAGGLPSGRGEPAER